MWHLGNLLIERAKTHGDRPFIIGSKRQTYAEAAHDMQKVATWLRDRGVQRGNRVMIITRNRAEAIVFALAAAQVGAIFSILHQTTKPHSLRQIVAQVEPVVVLLDETTASLASEFEKASIVGVGEAVFSDKIVLWDEVLRQLDGELPMFPGIDLDPVCLIFTSGSTQAPRGVILNHDNICFSLAAIQERLSYQMNDIIGLFLPLSFDYGLYQVFLAALAGASIYMGQPEDAGLELISKLETMEISVLPGVPSLFATMLKMLNRQPHPLPALRCLTNTGAHLPMVHVEMLHHLLPCAQIFLMYGLTECKRVSILRPEEIANKPGSVGRPLTGTEVFIVDNNGRPLPPGEIGELVVRGRHVTMGYWQAPEETARRFRQHAPATPCYLYTGDLCRLDEDGYLYFIERHDTQLKHQGFRISPLEIEAAACRITGVVEAGVVHQEGTDLLHLCLVVISREVTTEAVLAALSQWLEPFKVPEEVHIMATLPKTKNGKLDRKELLKTIETCTLNNAE